jgi:hypothetical protein
MEKLITVDVKVNILAQKVHVTYDGRYVFEKAQKMIMEIIGKYLNDHNYNDYDIGLKKANQQLFNKRDCCRNSTMYRFMIKIRPHELDPNDDTNNI